MRVVIGPRAVLALAVSAMLTVAIVACTSAQKGKALVVLTGNSDPVAATTQPASSDSVEGVTKTVTDTAGVVATATQGTPIGGIAGIVNNFGLLALLIERGLVYLVPMLPSFLKSAGSNSNSGTAPPPAPTQTNGTAPPPNKA